MKKLLTMSAIVFSAILLSGCGSSGSSSSSGHRYYIIMSDMPSGKCESNSYKSAVENKGAYNVSTEESNTSKSCSAYGGSNYCVTSQYDDTDAGKYYCVIGFDGIYSNDYNDDWGDYFWLDDGWDYGWDDDWWGYNDDWDDWDNDGWDDGWGDDGWDDW